MVADPAGICIRKIPCDGRSEFKGSFQESCASLGIIIETNAPYASEGNAVADRLTVGLAPLWVLRAASYWGRLAYRADCGLELFKPRSTKKKRTPTDVLDGKAPLEV